jgi:thiol-disulfide isomerase/thioredoxin
MLRVDIKWWKKGGLGFLTFAWAAVSAFSTYAQVGDHFIGKLIPELQPDFVHVYQRVLKKAPQPLNLQFNPALEKESSVTMGDLTDQRTASGKFSVLLVEPPMAPPFLCSDINGNGIVEATERFAFIASPSPTGDLDLLLRHPLRNPLFRDFPVFIRYKRGFTHPDLAPTDRLLLQTVWALAYGSVDIKGKKVLVQYPFDPQAASISTTEGLFGIDADGDGRIRNEQFSPETSYATNTELVFRLGDMFVSTSGIDLAKNEIILRTRLRSEYLRHEIAVGQEMPDFSFQDFAGKKRSLYEFKGKYLLIDFWGVWCADCIRETPVHVESLKRFRSRGFDILSLDTDEDPEIVKPYLKKNAVTWTQARNDSIRNLVEVTYRIQEYPSTILLGPDGKVLILDQDELRGERLLKTLDRILPR